tara:strand:+ start:306 stop:1358 length:1053 start_codon:yes stop_codon:yes gene_type:complete
MKNGIAQGEEMSELGPEPEYRYLVSFIIPISAIIGNYVGGYYSASAIIIALGIFPLLDHISGQIPEPRPARNNSKLLVAMLYAHGIINPIIILSFGYRIFLDGFTDTFWLAGLSTGMATGISGILVGHELGHTKPRSFGWWLARINLYLAFYGHFTTEHNYNHHKNVATEKDPVSAPLGRGLWLHMLYCIPGQYVSSWNIEKKRAMKREKNTFFLFNPIVLVVIIEVLFFISVWFMINQIVALAILYQAVVSIFLLEYVNYIRHYGLRREVNERQTEAHSWQTEKRLSRWALFELTRHPAHHLEASLPFWKLQPYEDAPSLPSGYFAIFWPCLIPPIWKRMMDKRIPQET